MRERPILFSGPMVRAILAGQKTQTRRVVRIPGCMPRTAFAITSPDESIVEWDDGTFHYFSTSAMSGPYPCPYGQPGDRLWVRESFSPYIYREGCWYWADGNMAAYDCEKPKPSIHMPRWASRITLEIIGVRVERLNDISEADCWAEGIAEVDGMLEDAAICDLAKRMGRSFEDAAPTFAALWESINGVGSWAANPWVWVVEFRRLIDG